MWLHVHLRVFFANKAWCRRAVFAPRSPEYLVGTVVHPLQLPGLLASDPRPIFWGSL